MSDLVFLLKTEPESEDRLARAEDCGGSSAHYSNGSQSDCETPEWYYSDVEEENGGGEEEEVEVDVVAVGGSSPEVDESGTLSPMVRRVPSVGRFLDMWNYGGSDAGG